MPVYEYRCKSCGKTHEIEHGFNDPRPSQCPSCGGPLVRVFHPVGVVFKGSGFHKTDYAGSGARSDGEAAKGTKSADGGEKKSDAAAAPSAKPSTDAASKKLEGKTGGSPPSGGGS